MAESITIINNSGKIISTGKQLLGIFKDAKAAYHDRKAHLKGPSPGIRRAQTFDVAHEVAYPGYPPGQYDDYYEYDYPQSPQHYQHQPEQRYIEAPSRRRSVDDDGRSVASSQRSHRSSRTNRTSRTSRTKHGDGGASEARRPPLTMSNLRTHSEVSSTAPSAVPRAYRSPYAETAPRDMMVSRPTLAHAATMPPSQAGDARTMVLPVHAGPPGPPGHADLYYNAPPEASFQQAVVTRPRSDPALRQKKSIDMDLAYGSVPPDLESRTDLEPKQVEVKDPEQEARGLMERIESMLIEAECLQHSAATIIDKLQTNPEAAAAVALTLAELSALLTKMSPAFLGVVKGGAPAVFALLASPQFLIAATAAVGVTVVMFGGFKIVKRMREEQARQALPVPAQPAIEMGAVPAYAPSAGHPASHYPYPPTQYAQTEYEPSAHPQDPGYAYDGARGPGSHYEEALVVEEELSSIERWRRGIEIDEETETTVDMELISPEALRSTIGDDAMSVRTKRTKSRRDEVPERKSSRKEEGKSRKDEGRSRKDEGKSRKDEERKSRRDEDGRRKHRDDQDDRSVAGSERSRSKKTRSVKAIEDGSRDQVNTLDSVLKKEKKGNMLKSLFKKKERERGEVSVMA
ncbi:hypothetical protein RB595_002032 [Gaeumannomyces hyphopodioides]